MPAPARALPPWLAGVDLACAAAAAALWFAWPAAGPWPLALALPPWVLRLGWTGRLARRTPFAPPLLLFLATAALGVWAAYDRPVAWHKFWLITGGLLLFYALLHAEPIAGLRRGFLGLAAPALALYFLLTHDWDAYPAKIEALTRLGRALQPPLPSLPGPHPHPNIVGSALAVMLPFTAALALHAWRPALAAPRPRAPRAWLLPACSLALLALALLGLLLTTSRGAWLALAAALLLWGLWALAGWLARGHPARRAWVFPGLLVLGLALALGLAAAWPGGLVQAVRALPGADTWLGRADLLRNTPTLVRDYPFTGGGLGGFQMLYSTYVLLLHVGFTTHSHNLFLDVLVEQGLFGLLALLWIVILAARAAWRAASRPRPGRDTADLGAALLSLAVVLIHGLVDDPLYGSRAVLLLFLPLALVALPPAPRPVPVRRALALGLPAATALLLVAALLGQRGLLSRLCSNLGAVHQARAELGVYAWPRWPLQDAVRRTVDLDRPLAEFQRALAFDPRNATANRRLGMIELSRGDYPAALAHLAAAYQAEPHSRTTRQLYGEALLVNGWLDEGRALWAGLGDDQGQRGARVYWYRHIGDTERAAWLQQALTSP